MTFCYKWRFYIANYFKKTLKKKNTKSKILFEIIQDYVMSFCSVFKHTNVHPERNWEWENSIPWVKKYSTGIQIP